MTNHEAIVKLVQAGMIKFPEPETRSVQAMKHSLKRRTLPLPPSSKPANVEASEPTLPQGAGRTFPQDVMAIADAAKREKYRVPLRGPNFKEQRYVVRAKDLNTL